MNDLLDRLAGQYGIAAWYYDYRGGLHEVSRDTKTALLAAMGVDASTELAVDQAAVTLESTRWTHLLPACVVVAEAQGAARMLPVAIPLDAEAGEIDWEIELEEGGSIDGVARVEELEIVERGNAGGRDFVRVNLPLPASLPLGYHRISTWLDVGLAGETRLIVTPSRCYQPPAVAAGARSWGIAVQLYALRSERNWGMGDLRDLRECVDLVAPLGCGIVGLNPLHALLPAVPDQVSPYSPSNRQFLNVLYIAVPEVPEFAECESARQHVADAQFQAMLEQLRAKTNVDYVQVAAAKFTVLRMLFEHFREHHLEAGTERAAEFRRFVEERGESLRLHAVFDALDADLRLQGPQYWGWPSWPEEYRDPLSPAVNRFARERASEVDYFLYLQWLAEEQLGEVQQLARERGMVIGLYGDVAVGANPAGSENWANKRLYLQQASIGAPPDALALKGQDWGIPPQDPTQLRVQEYEPFILLMRNSMRATAALRLDHVMTLFRLWWVPRGSTSAQGAYVHYPLEDLIGILALESVRNRCVIIGEDLGTVPDEVRDAMERYEVYHYKVLLFEKEPDQRFKAPGQYVRNALATVTTHDLPTLRGWWEGLDIGLRERLNLYPDPAQAEEDRNGRARERAAMMHALTENGLWRWQPNQPVPDYSPPLARAIQCYLGSSNASIAMVQIEDLIGMTDPANVPGTLHEHANWQRKVVVDTTAIFARPEVLDMLRAMNTARQGKNPNA